MRLIDADKLHPDRMTNRGTVAISQSQIANAPTVDVLDKIRAEIKKEMSNADSVDYLNGLNRALMIINEKYR